MPNKIAKLSIIIPSYNEGKNILKNIRYAVKIFGSLPMIKDFEIIVVDDGSIDNTRSEAAKISNRHVKIIGYEKNMGKGHALIYGVGFAKGDYILFLDADMEIDPRQIRKLLSIITFEDTDAAIFSKNMMGSKINSPLYRKILSRGYYFIAHVLINLPVNDTQVGCKIFRSSVLKNISHKIKTKKFAFDLELITVMYMMGSRIIEVPVEINFSREAMRIKLRNILRMFLDTLDIFYRYRIKKFNRI